MIRSPFLSTSPDCPAGQAGAGARRSRTEIAKATGHRAANRDVLALSSLSCLWNRRGRLRIDGPVARHRGNPEPPLPSSPAAILGLGRDHRAAVSAGCGVLGRVTVLYRFRCTAAGENCQTGGPWLSGSLASESVAGGRGQFGRGSLGSV